MERLVLFDIDGTLLQTGGAGARAVTRALKEVYGEVGPIDSYSFAGKTDTQIVEDLMHAAGIDADTVENRAPQLWRKYLDYLDRELKDGKTRPCPGVPELLDAIEANGERAVLGLLTGNIRGGARAKLEAAGIEPARFDVGAFGCDHRDRSRLPPLAVVRAFEFAKHRFERKAIVIVGDTPADISCGAELDVRTVAVATGSFSRDELAEHAPDHLFDSLDDLDAALDAIFS